MKNTLKKSVLSEVYRNSIKSSGLFFCLIFSILLTSFSCSSPGEKNAYSLENSTTRLVIKNNRIISLYDKVRMVEHISPAVDSSAGLIHIKLVKGIQPASEINAVQMNSSVVSSKSDELELEFSHQDVTSRVKISLSPNPGEILWSVSVSPIDASLMVGSVSFPVFETPVLSDGIEKKCLLPYFEGQFHPITIPTIITKPKVYPATLFAQMTACIGQSGGFLLWTSDTVPNVKEFTYNLEKTDAVFTVIHRMPYEPGEWKASYETRISFCDPTWYDAAEIYRNWASEQYWCAIKYKDRTDMPAFLHHPHFHSSVQLSKEPDLKSVPGKLADLSKQLDAPIVVRGTFWEKHGGWIGIDYFPPSIGEEGLRSINKNLKSKDIQLICEIAGYKWTSGKEKGQVLELINNASPELRSKLEKYFIENDGPAICEMGRDGNLNANTTICRGSDFGKKYLPDMARHLFDYGITTFDFDSDPGTTPDGVSACFNAAHGHPVPCGSWSTENTRNSFREIHAEAARRGIENFFFIKEHCTEQLNMEMHAYLSRLSLSYAQPNTVPLTQFLYHEYLPVMLYNSKLEELNDIIILGQIPGGSTLQASVPVTVDYYAAMKTFAKDYLLYGKMLKPLISGIPDSILLFEDSKTKKTIEIPIPVVRQSAWEDESGNIGLFAVNTLAAETKVIIPVPGKGKWQASFFLGGEEKDTQSVTGGQSLEWTIVPGRLEAVVFKAVQE